MADGSAFEQSYDKHQIAAALQISVRAALQRAEREAWRFSERAVKGGRQRRFELANLPADVQTALLVKHAPVAGVDRPVRAARTWSEEQLQSLNARLERATDKHRAIALRRQQAIAAVDALVANGTRRLQARAQVAEQLQREGFPGGTAASIARWEAVVDGAPRNAWHALLLPDYLGRTATATMPEEAWDAFKSDWLRASAPSAASCYGRLQRVATARGWKLPSLDTFERRAAREIPRAVRILARAGEEALLRTFPSQERDKSMFNALDAVNADGHKFDVFVRWPTGQVVRPIMVGVQDIGSGKLLAYRVSETESSDLARLAFMDVVRNFGIPRDVWLDNGRAFASKLLTGGIPNRYRFKVREEDPTGVLVALGMQIHWATPYHGQAKPIERAWRDLCDRIAKHPAFDGAYTGNSPDAKPEDYGSRAVPYDTFMRVLQQEIIAHNAQPGRRSKACAGRSFDAVFNASYAQATIRKATSDQLRQMLLAAEVVNASTQDGSVRLGGNRYWHEALSAHAGARLTIRFDPENLHTSISVFTLAGVFVADAPCVAAVGFADTSAGREHARARKQYRRSAKDMLTAQRRMEAAAVAAQIPDAIAPELPPAPVIGGVFGKRPLFDRTPAEPEPERATGTHGGPPTKTNFRRMLEQQASQMAKDNELAIKPGTHE